MPTNLLNDAIMVLKESLVPLTSVQIVEAMRSKGIVLPRQRAEHLVYGALQRFYASTWMPGQLLKTPRGQFLWVHRSLAPCVR